ncbi:hypothetical protein ACFPN0_15260 [Kitasatospora cinereorecta]
MSGCCGQGPVIVSGAAAAPRVDVETVLLCDVLPDGTVAGVALVEPIYDTSTGARVSTRTVNPTTGAPYVPTGTLQPCATGSAASDCEALTTPTATVGVCLADGTPIAVTVVRDCDGVVTSEGWINLTTGAWSAGAPPAGTMACGDARTITVSGTFCDVDGAGEVVGLVLVEYTYDDTGAIASVRLVDAVTGDTYAPTGTVTVCPAGTSQPERDVVQLCDTATDGTVTPFVRDYARNEVGAIVGHSDYTLGGTAYTPTGTVGTCGAVTCETLQLCDSSPAPVELGATSLDDPSPWRTLACPTCLAVDNPTLPGGLQALFDGGSVTFPLTPTSSATGSHHWAAGALAAEGCSCPDAEVTLTISAAFLNNGPANQQGGGTGLYLYDGDTLLDTDGTLAPVGTSDTLTVSATVPLASIQAGTVTLLFQVEGGQQGSQKTWTVSAFDVQATSDCGQSFLRTVCRDDRGTVVIETDTLDGTTPYTAVGDVQPCSGPESGCGGGTSEPCRNSSTVLVCDVPADGSSEITPTLVDSNVAAVGQSQFQNHPGPYAALWSGGTFIYPAGAGPAQEHLAATGQLTADLSGCDGASGTVTISVRVRNDGPNPGQAWDGALRLFRGTTALATHNALEWAPSGWQGTLTVSAPVTAADITAGDIRVALMLETFHLDAKSWTADQFTASLELEGCELTASTKFLRTLVTDCASGNVVSTVDTTLDGDPYTVTGTVGQCTPTEPANECRDCEQLVLCDTTDEGASTFLRSVCRDCTGAVISTLDTTLDGTAPYAVAGTVGVCATPPAECEAAAVQAFRLCDLNPDVAPDDAGRRCAVPFLRHFVYACDGTSTFHDTEMDGVTAYAPVQVVECGDSPPSLREQVWNTVSVAQDPANPLVFTYTVANSEDPSQTGTVKMTATKAFGGGCGGTPTAPVWNGPVSFTFEPDANVMELADILRVDAIDWDSWEDKQLSPAPSRVESDLGHSLNPGNRWHTASNNNMGHFYFDGPPALVAMFNRNDGGGLACVAPAFGFITLVPGPPCGGVAEIDHIVQPLCDTPTAGTVTSFLRHWTVNNSTGLLTALQDTTLDGATAYVPTGTVTVCGQQPDAPLLTGVRRLTGSTTIQNLKTEFPGLQSVSLSVLVGAVNVALSSGSGHAIPAGASVTWSVADTDDSSLAAASFAGASATSDYFLVWTYKAGAAG